jgi:cytoskeleton protein RodZ
MTSESIGQRLTRCREAMGLTTATAAARLYCDESIIVSLEADRFAEIGARVFVQGHLRRYADLVGAPTAELMTDWAAQGAVLTAPDLTRIPRAPMPVVNSQAWARRLGIVAAAVVIAVAAWWILQGAGVSGQSTTSSVPGQTQAVASTEVASTGAPAAPEAISTPVTSTQTVTATPSAVEPTAIAATGAAPAALGPTSSSGRVVIAIETQSDCWVEIYDATGKKLYFDNVSRGTSARAAGVSPLRVLLGRADVAALQVDGRPVTIPAQLIRNSTAYFTVDAAGALRPYVKPEDSVVPSR